MVNAMLRFRAMIAKTGRKATHMNGTHSATERAAFLRALKRPIVFKPAVA